MRSYTKAAVVTLGLSLVMLGIGTIPFAGLGQAQGLCSTEFSGTALDPGLTTYVPRSGPTFSLTSNPGHFRMSLPATRVFDHWTFVDGSPQLRCAAPNGNFELTTRAKVVLPTAADLNYHVGLVVVFSSRDAIYWGDYRGQEIRMERSGIRPGISAGLTNPTAELDLKITRSRTTAGDFYTFSYRAAGKADWIDVGSYTTDKTPQYVGVISKTWAGVRVLADFDYLKLSNI